MKPDPMLPINSHSSQPQRQSRNENSREIRGCFSGFHTMPLRPMGAEGLETNGQNAGKTGCSPSIGPRDGPTAPDAVSVALLRLQAVTELNQGLHTLKRLQEALGSTANRATTGEVIQDLRTCLTRLEKLSNAGE